MRRKWQVSFGEVFGAGGTAGTVAGMGFLCRTIPELGRVVKKEREQRKGRGRRVSVAWLWSNARVFRN